MLGSYVRGKCWNIRHIKKVYWRINDEVREINCCGENVCCANSSKSIYDEIHFPSGMEEEPLTPTVVAGELIFSSVTSSVSSNLSCHRCRPDDVWFRVFLILRAKATIESKPMREINKVGVFLYFIIRSRKIYCKYIKKKSKNCKNLWSCTTGKCWVDEKGII